MSQIRAGSAWAGKMWLTTSDKVNTVFLLIIWCHQGLLLTLFPARISNCAHYKLWDEITYPFPNFNGWGMHKWFHPTLYRTCDFLSMNGLKLTHVSKKWPRAFADRASTNTNCLFIYTRPTLWKLTWSRFHSRLFQHNSKSKGEICCQLITGDCLVTHPIITDVIPLQKFCSNHWIRFWAKKSAK